MPELEEGLGEVDPVSVFAALMRRVRALVSCVVVVFKIKYTRHYSTPPNAAFLNANQVQTPAPECWRGRA